MTVYQTVPTVATSDAWSASQHNTYIRDNFKAIMENAVAGAMPYWSVTTGFASLGLGTATGGIIYGNGTIPAILRIGTATGGLLYGNGTIPAVLAKPASVTSYPTVSSAGAVAHASIGRVMAVGYASFAPGQSDGAGTFIDITNATTTLSLPTGNTYTIIAIAGVAGYVNNSSFSLQVCAMIDGTLDTNQLSILGTTVLSDMPVGFRRTGIASGSRIVKLQFRCFSAGGTATVDRGWLLAIAITE